jgi:hypothetical protein
MRIRQIVWSVSLLAWFLLTESALEAQFTRGDWNRANEATVRLTPSAFPNLAVTVRTELEHRGCTVPQPWGERAQNINVISGEFTSAGQKEWAVLCSRQQRSAILVFHAGASNEIEKLVEQSDVQYLQVISGGAIRGNWQPRRRTKFGDIL